jgi:spermidine/putrescine transport system permease protein
MATTQRAPARAREASRSTPRPSGRARRATWILPAWTGLVIAYLFVPIVVMILFGFNDYTGRFNYTWQGFTLRWYQNLFDFPELTLALRNSLIIASISALVATVLGTLIALALSRFRFRGRSALNLFIFIPMATPEIVMGVSLLALFVSLDLARGMLTIIIAHIMFLISFVVVTVKARTSGFDRNLEDAAQDLGADSWTTFWTVTFPLILPGIAAGGVLAFVLSFDDYVVTTFNAGATTTLTLWIYGASRIGIPAQVNVMGTIIFAIGVLYAIVSLVRARRESTPTSR